MAENKKSFIAYVDWGETFSALPDDKAGQLVKHLFDYVNDKNPETDDVLIKAVFANIKQQLKRDLIKWEGISSQRSDIGRIGGIKSGEARQSKTKQTKQVLQKRSKTKQNEHVTVTVNDTVTVKEESKNTLPPFEDFKSYALENEPLVNLKSLELKYKAWIENNWRDGNGKKISNWKSKLLNTIPYLNNNSRPKTNDELLAEQRLEHEQFKKQLNGK